MGCPLFHQQEVVLPHTNKCCKFLEHPITATTNNCIDERCAPGLMREWARDNGKSVSQRTVRQETTKYKSGTLPLNLYQSEEQIGEKVKFDGASDDEEDPVDEYSSQSSSCDSDMLILMKN